MSDLPMRVPRPLNEAAHIAALCYARLEPLCQRLVVAGSIRRGAALCSDVEIVMEPLMNPDLFGGDTPILDPVVRALADMGEITKQGQRYIQVRDVLGQKEFNLDLFLVHPPAQWGSIVAIRTGPWQLSRYCVMQMKERGFKHLDGAVYDSAGKPLPVLQEADFFSYAGVRFVPPEERTELAHRLGAMSA